MKKTPEALLDWSIPDRHHNYTKQETAFYALSVGFGADALDTKRFAFIDPWANDMLALPSMALVLGYPGFWLGQPEVAETTGIETPQILHVEQSVTLHESLPASGSVIGKTKVTGLADRGPGKGAFLYSERQIIDAGKDQLLARCQQTHLLRDVDVDGNSSSPVPLAPSPSEEPAKIVELQNRPEQALIYRLNGDANPLHIDPDVAARAGFKTPILHGMCTIGMAVGGLVKSFADYHPDRIKRFSVRMSKPVYAGEKLSLKLWNNGAFQVVATDRDAITLDRGLIELSG